jgi:hypothetical protein
MTDASQASTPQPFTRHGNHEPRHGAFSAQARFQTLDSAVSAEQHYRELAWTYYQSPQYAAMVERYPLLQSSIAACQSMALISDASAPSTPHPPATADLRWERSHGED